MKRTFYILVVFLSAFFARAQAQSQQTINIGIIPFDALEYNAGTDAKLVEDQVQACFVNKSRFALIDRSQTERLKGELERAKDNASAYAKIVAEQGHLMGAQYLIAGKVGSLSVSSSTVKNYIGTGTTTTYHGNMHISVQVNSVETGQVVETYNFSIQSNDMSSSANSDILDNILCKFKAEFRVKVRSLLNSSEIAIVKIEKEKNGLPQQVIINAGKELFENGKNSSCGVTLTNLFASKKIFLDVIAVEVFSPTSKREKKVGELRVESVEGDVTVCKVTKGDKEIKELLDNKKAMEIVMQ